MSRILTIILILGGLTSTIHPVGAQEDIVLPEYLRDLNQDGSIDWKDLLLLLQVWGLKGITTPIPTATFTFTITPTMTETKTSSPTESSTPTFTEIPTLTETETPTDTPTPSPTETPTVQNLLSLELPERLPMRLKRIPAGSFQMGTPDAERGRDLNEGPVHEVVIETDFFMGETEVTMNQWYRVMGSIPDFVPNGPDLPVTGVSWNDCQEFIATLNSLGLGTFRLPSEAEWEYACRANTTTRFFFGNSTGCHDFCDNCEVNEIVVQPGRSEVSPEFPSELIFEKGRLLRRFRDDYMHYCWNGGAGCGSGMCESSARPVRQLFPNSFGLYDMSGSVSEWCQDVYHDSYSGAPTDGSSWESGGDLNRKVVRGGSWRNVASLCRSGSRSAAFTPGSNDALGFRVVMNP